ncbi:MAG: monovalent cation/H+ antiporter complex subunit F [Fervidobacterium sp.]|uniref:monovalent cation/H+ antiporter complex subunit F n=1 Tax=Fervidobacterium sp. TaxID=1871331 RepID=UPI004048EAE9
MSGSLLIDLIVFGFTGLGIFLTLVRFLLGPTSLERLVAVDMMNVMFIGVLVMIAYIFKNNMYMDIALLYGLLTFIETLVFARYLENQAARTADGDKR